MEVLYAGGWRVESVWLDRDGTGPRTWNRCEPPWGGEVWLTNAALQEALHADGLDFGDLAYASPGRVDGRGDRCG